MFEKSNYIFLLELIVEDLEIFANQRAGRPSLRKASFSEASVDGEGEAEVAPVPVSELCVRFELPQLVRCEVCERDFGAAMDTESRKTGENCLFTLPSGASQGSEIRFRVSALEKQAEGKREVIGVWEEPADAVLEELCRSYDEVNGCGTTGSVESLTSAGSRRSHKSRPVSETIKMMYPLRQQDNADNVVGFVILTIRLSCLGPRISQKVIIGGAGHETPAVTCFKTDEDTMLKCVGFDEIVHPHPTVCDACEPADLLVPRGSLVTMPPTPSPSMTSEHPYDEYSAELNGNAICIRVDKEANIAVSLADPADSKCTKGCWTSLTLPDGVYGLEEKYVQHEMNACRLPVVRGNLKYPAYQWSGDFLMCKQQKPITIDDFRKRPDPTRSVCLQTPKNGPEQQPTDDCDGIEICRKGWHDPNVDVFVLKLGKDKRCPGSGRNQIEVELRTPKGPTQERRPKETRGVQVIEEEFEISKPKPAAEVPPPDVAAKKPKAGAKKGKGKGKGKK